MWSAWIMRAFRALVGPCCTGFTVWLLFKEEQRDPMVIGCRVWIYI